MKFYRYEFVQYASLDETGDLVKPMLPNPTIELREYNLHKETPKGYWIGYGEPRKLLSSSRWVPKTSRKRYAYPTKKEAMESFKARTQRRISILSAQIRVCQIALGRAENENIR